MRAAQDEQIRLKDVEINELKSLRMDLDRELRDTRVVSERVSWYLTFVWLKLVFYLHTVYRIVFIYKVKVLREDIQIINAELFMGFKYCTENGHKNLNFVVCNYFLSQSCTLYMKVH